MLLRKAAPMASRTTQTVVHFSSAFRLPGFEAWQPAGDYRADRLRGSSRLAWRRVGALIHLPAIALQSSAKVRRNRWCSSAQQTSTPLSKRTLDNHDRTIDHATRPPRVGSACLRYGGFPCEPVQK